MQDEFMNAFTDADSLRQSLLDSTWQLLDDPDWCDSCLLVGAAVACLVFLGCVYVVFQACVKTCMRAACFPCKCLLGLARGSRRSPGGQPVQVAHAGFWDDSD